MDRLRIGQRVTWMQTNGAAASGVIDAIEHAGGRRCDIVPGGTRSDYVFDVRYDGRDGLNWVYGTQIVGSA